MNSFASLVELIQTMTYKLKCDTIQNFEKKLTYNFKMLKTWNNTCMSTTLNTRKKIETIEIIIMVVTQNVKILKDCIKVQGKKRKSLSCVHVCHKM